MVKKTTLWLLILLLYSFTPLFLSHSTALDFSPYNYLIFQLIIFGIVGSLKGYSKNRFVFSPSFIAVTYINLNFFFGSIVFERASVYAFLLGPYAEWSNSNFVMGYFNLANFAIILSYFIGIKTPSLFKIQPICNLKNFSSQVLFLSGVLLITIFVFYDLNLNFLGGQGSYSVVPKTLGALFLIVTIFKFPSLGKRLLYYLILLIFFSVISWEDKRDAIFLLLPILILESTKFKIAINLKKLILACFSLFVILYLILLMSITRGYGGYKADTFMAANSYVLDYINSNDFVPGFMNNLEISYTYLHSNNAIERIIKEPELITYGGTIVKPLFMFVPRNLYENKPKSIIHHYTHAYSKEYRNSGGSWTISIQSEMFWNFHFFGIFFGAMFFLVFNAVYHHTIELIKNDNIVNYLPLLYFYEVLLVLFRGSGMDLFLIYIILSTAIFLVFTFGLRFINEIIKRT